jgi:uncharacterized membrane protein
MANQYEYEDETEEQDNGPAELRKALKKAQKEREAIEAELSKLRSDMRSRSVKDVLAAKGVSDKLAKLIPSDVDTPSGEQSQHQKVMAAKTKDELDQLLFGQSLGR